MVFLFIYLRIFHSSTCEIIHTIRKAQFRKFVIRDKEIFKLEQACFNSNLEVMCVMYQENIPFVFDLDLNYRYPHLEVKGRSFCCVFFLQKNWGPHDFI